MTTLTKTGIVCDEFHIWRAEEWDDETLQLVTRWYIAVNYRVLTTEGEEWRRDVTEELVGPIKVKGAALLADIEAYILTKEGL